MENGIQKNEKLKTEIKNTEFDLKKKKKTYFIWT